MSSNNINKLAREIKEIYRKLTILEKKHLEEKDPKKKEKLYEQGIKNREKMLTVYAKIKELTAFNTPASTPVKKIDPQKRKIMEQNKIHGNSNINLKRIKKKSRKK
jgi:hypothetical protein